VQAPAGAPTPLARRGWPEPELFEPLGVDEWTYHRPGWSVGGSMSLIVSQQLEQREHDW